MLVPFWVQAMNFSNTDQGIEITCQLLNFNLAFLHQVVHSCEVDHFERSEKYYGFIFRFVKMF